LNQIRAAIRSIVPSDAIEIISYKIPAFKHKKDWFSLSALFTCVLLSCRKNVLPSRIPDFCLPEPFIVFAHRQIAAIAQRAAVHRRPTDGRFHPL
jgi:hypothetical protein